MLKMIIELDEKRMIHAGVDVIAAWDEINNMASGIKEIEQTEKGVFVTNNAGARSWFMKLLEDTEWFMKYVKTWDIDDPGMHDDVIEGMRDLGYKCSYE